MSVDVTKLKPKRDTRTTKIITKPFCFNVLLARALRSGVNLGQAWSPLDVKAALADEGQSYHLRRTPRSSEWYQ
jgi:hypothetical protein